MSTLPPTPHRRLLAPFPCIPVDPGLVFSVGIVQYRSEEELAAQLAALRAAKSGHLVVVAGLHGGRCRVSPDFNTATAKLILTTDAVAVATEPIPGWFEPNPFRAVVTAMTGLEQGDALLLLFPVDWQGTPPERLIEEARRWRAGPHSPVDDVYFGCN